jgi:tetrahydromethanopterin S-methyltransferase subunit G
MLVFLWIIFAFLIANMARSRRIGFISGLLVSLILSPLIGFIIVAFSEKNTETLQKLKIGYDAGHIPKEEYDKKLREIIPNKQDKRDMLIGYGIVTAIGLIIYLVLSR